LKNYQELEKELLSEFDKNDFEKRMYSKQQKTFHPKAKSNIQITYPGYKATKDSYGIKYDYKVEINNIALSHINIIVDIYVKTYKDKQKAQIMNELLDELFKRPFLESSKLAFYEEIFKDTKLLDAESTERIKKLVNSIKDFDGISFNYDPNGNLNWNYTISELSEAISYIVMQEDINYSPLKNEKLQGRKMPFYRYKEAVNINLQDKLSYEINDVIERALIRKQPILFDDVKNYNHDWIP